MRILQEHLHDPAAHAHTPLEEILLYGAGLFAIGAMAYAYLRHIRPRRKGRAP